MARHFSKDTQMTEGLGAGGEADDRGWDGWMASPTWCTWVWVNSGSWWWTGRPGMLRFMGLQRVRHDWANELNWTARRLKRYTMWELRAKFYLGQKWGLQPGDSTSAPQRWGQGRGEGQYICDSGKERLHGIKHIFFQKVSAGLVKLLLVTNNSRHHEGF